MKATDVADSSVIDITNLTATNRDDFGSYITDLSAINIANLNATNVSVMI